MADHWKSIANLVGAPGVDDSQQDEEIVQGPPETAATDKPVGDAALTPSQLPDESHSEPETKPKSSAASETEAFVPDAQPPKSTVPAKKRKSSWESLARMFNIPIERAEVEVEDVVAKPVPPVNEEVKAPVPPKAAPRSAPTPSRPAELSLFKSDEEPTDANPALKKMFGETSKIPADGWGAKRRVVDDVSWEDEDVAASIPKTADDTTSASEPAGDELDDAGDVRRGRRRRRRGRRGGQADVARDSDASATPQDSQDDTWGAVSEFESPVESSVEWDEPETFETEVVDERPESSERRSSRRRKRGRDRARAAEETTTEIRGAERAPEPAPRDEPPEGRRREPVRGGRRPSEGRDSEGRDSEGRDSGGRGRDSGGRSGRGRSSEGRTASGSRSAEGRTAESRSAEPRGDETRSRSRPVVDDEAGRGEREGRRPRRTRAEPRREPPVLDGAIEDPDSELIPDEDSVDEVTRHRNIPTWQDSLESIISANTENHKRNDNRGGPRGRSRGRR